MENIREDARAIRLKLLLSELLSIFEKIGWPPTPVEFPTLYLLIICNRESAFYNEKISILYRKLLIENKIEPSRIIDDFSHILLNDNHLYNCCYDIFTMAVLIDKMFLPSLRVDNFEKTFTDFVTLIYNTGNFNKISFSHLYNFDCSEDKISFEEFEIIKIDEKLIPNITGENSFFPSFLHQFGVGNYFITFKNDSYIKNEDITEWLNKCHISSMQISGLFQYIKDGIVHIDYTGIYFLPEWVNYLRRPGIYMVGRPRVRVYEKKYILSSADINMFHELFPIFQKYRSKIFDAKNDLRNHISLAGNYYEISMQSDRSDTQFIDLWIAMEIMFSPSDKDQLSHRIAENAAFLLGESSSGRYNIYNNLRSLYKKRSKIVHGGKGKDIKQQDIELLSSYVRRSLVKLTVIQLNNLNSIKEVHEYIESAIFDPNKCNNLTTISNLKSLIAELENVEIEIII